MNSKPLFSSKSITEHIIRGLAGAASLVCAGMLLTTHPIIAVMLVVAALFAFRGCPVCWTVGLWGTFSRQCNIKKSPKT